MLESTMKAGSETIEIWKYGEDDYAVYFRNADCSVRGTLLEIMKEINEAFDIESITQA